MKVPNDFSMQNQEQPRHRCSDRRRTSVVTNIMGRNSSALQCALESDQSRFIFTAWSCVYFLFLPVFLAVVAVGYRKRQSLSLSDVFTFHMTAMEMVSVAGCAVGCYGLYARHDALARVAENLVIMTGVGQVCFHSLTCVERYLAVVHPIIYLHLRQRGGVRNAAIGCAWLLSVGQICVIASVDSDVLDVALGCVFSILPFALVSFCSISVLCVLIRPRPGERGGDRQGEDQCKRSAFYTMAAILAVLLLRLVAFIVYHAIFLVFGHDIDDCVLSVSSQWFSLPSSLVLPLLFLRRSAKLHG